MQKNQQLEVEWDWRRGVGVCESLVIDNWKWHCKRKGKEMSIYRRVENSLVHKIYVNCSMIQCFLLLLSLSF